SFFGTLGVNAGLDLDEKTLSYMAEQTGGRYFRAKTTDELADVYKAIDTLEQADSPEQVVRPKTELFYIPLMISMVLLLAAVVLKRRLV
ncbi:MAG: BatB protein, partial [Alphaproteobacteria bacterium]